MFEGYISAVKAKKPTPVTCLSDVYIQKVSVPYLFHKRSLNWFPVYFILCTEKRASGKESLPDGPRGPGHKKDKEPLFQETGGSQKALSLPPPQHPTQISQNPTHGPDLKSILALREVLWAGQLVPGHPDMKNLQQACSLLVVQWPFCRTVLWSQGAHWEALEDPEPSGEETCCSGKSKSTWVQSPPRTVTTSLTSGDLPASIPEICTLPQSIGSCRGSFPRYYYNKFARRCERFLYGGCGGNRNNFIFVEQCQLACRENK
uniref:Early lactation protein n=1 Tax=Phascolarctos cinereus TaxID=38626 RepID=A0A6P5IGE3_PHACI|nr:kunitz-type protease inhibitor 4 isoform X1 [Phascolarctos cinereus]